MKNNHLKNILKVAINLSIKENKNAVPLLNKAYQIIETNEKLKLAKEKKEKNKLLSNNHEITKRNIQIIDDLIKKESEILNKSLEKNNDPKDSNQLLIS